MFNRGCREYLTPEELVEKRTTCAKCRKHLSGKSAPCQHEGCSFSVESGSLFCGKHARDVFRKHAMETGTRYCNIDRGCASILGDGETVCRQCTHKKTLMIVKELEDLRNKTTQCLKCHTYPKKSGHFCGVCAPTIYHCIDEISKRSSAGVWSDIYNGATKRTYLFVLSLTEVHDIIVRPCAYCGRFSNSVFNGIDRVDNTKGYISSNVVACCTMCNIMKNTTPFTVFYTKLRGICAFQTHGIPMIETDTMWDGFRTKKNIPYNTYKNNVIKNRGLTFELTADEYTAFKNAGCYLCGIAASLTHRNGIDRLDSGRGYILDNCRTCCTHCNMMKSDFSLEEFVKQCRRILQYSDHETFYMVTETSSSSITSRMRPKTEMYGSADLYRLIQERKLEHIVEWAKTLGKSAMFIEGLCGVDTTNRDCAILEIQHHMEMERSRAYRTRHEEVDDSPKHYSAAKVYACLLHGEADVFVQWYTAAFNGVSPSFHAQLNELIEKLKASDKDSGIELCRQFLTAERNRRKSIRSTVLKHDLLGGERSRAVWTATKIAPPIALAPPPTKIPENILVIESPIPVMSAPVPTAPRTSTAPVFTIPKQWKATIIYDAIVSGCSDLYKKHCEENNDLSKYKWAEKWDTFCKSVLETGAFEKAQPIISDFITELRSVRHAELLEKSKKDLLDREGRTVWPKETVLHAYKSGKLDMFKTYNESYANVSGPAWDTRWDGFVGRLSETLSDEDALAVIQKFQTNLRMQRYRTNKKTTSD